MIIALLLSLNFICLISCTIIGQSDVNQYFEQYQWKNRLLLIFAPSSTDSTFKKTEQQAKKYEDEIIDRDLLLIYAVEKGTRTVNNSLLSDSMSLAIRDKYGVSSGKFTLILIGKDGGEKLRQEERIDFKEIFSRIDAMPMRRAEMQERTKKK